MSYLWIILQDCSRHTIRQGLDDDDTPGTSVVEAGYAFPWRAKTFGRYGFGGSPEDLSAWVGWYAGLLGGSGAFLTWWQADPNADPVLTVAGGFGATRFRRATVGYWPATGYRDNLSGAPLYVATLGNVWPSSRYPVAYPQSVSFLNFSATDVIPSYPANRSCGLSVRCVQAFANRSEN